MPEIQHTFFIFLRLAGLMANVYADKIMFVWFAGWRLDRLLVGELLRIACWRRFKGDLLKKF